ncbi:HAD family hydrolase [Raoultibacter phocaeensis]|uniref:HAD family hydrolase n=1 Tax=Raoultibacter phocaeensis TaxID=2479841 RepID=UPI0011192412|nr:HAD family hydrolase [Raoultibacter phocaeensis]
MEQTPYRAIFFDLDGTLLPMDLGEFMQSYFERLAGYVAAHGVDPETFTAGLKAGIKAMASHDDSRLNSEAYWEAFFTIVDEGAADWIPLVSEFYERDFGEIGRGVVADPDAARAVSALRSKGYPLVLATMPMFPLAAVKWRLRWAGIDPSAFSRITNYENSTSVKPKLAYYAENLRAAGLDGSDVLMVGNNTLEDLACLDLGMDAYLVTDHLLDPAKFDLSTVKHSRMAAFADWAEALPVCEAPAADIVSGPVAHEA